MEIPLWLGGPVEPTSDARSAANYLRQMYVALIEAGFDESQAMTILIAFTKPGE